ncbi:MAG TPA: ABC transporter ATP-binding protein [Candidatus Eisenbacteria bacterium]|nr:ABC transporter ATP-binding protein [Candidatus Eisenbacteria bacterium]
MRCNRSASPSRIFRRFWRGSWRVSGRRLPAKWGCSKTEAPVTTTLGDIPIHGHYHRVKFLIERHRRFLILGLCALVATDIAGMALPWLVKGGIDAALYGQPASGSLVKFPLLILAAAALQGFFRYCWRVNIHGFSRRCEADLRDRVFAHLQRLPLSYFNRVKTGDLMSRLTNDVQAVRELMGFGSLAIVDALVVIVFSISLMITIDPWLTLWSMLAMPSITVVVRFFGRHIFRWSRHTQEQLSALSAFVQENLSGIRVVQAYAQEANHIARFRRLSSEYREKTMWLATLWGIFWPLMQVLAGIAATIVLWLGGRQVLQGTMTLGEFVAFNGYLAMLTWPMMAVGYVVNSYQRGVAALERLGEVLDTPVSPRYRTAATPAGRRMPVPPAVEFRNLSFAYDDGPPVLTGVSFKIAAGQTCGIVGETGSGKSTLAQVLLRLYEPPDGSVLVGGIDVKSWPVRELQRAAGFVSQDVFLFSGTIRENILFGAEDGALERVEHAARVAQLLPAIREFGAGFETTIGERGARLSGGQKQRAALARALVKDPALLILDDAFSSVDAETEEAILRALKPAMRNRTTLLIAQRASAVRDADVIVYLRAGAVIEQGTHDQLLKRRGAYWELYQKQRLMREVEGMIDQDGLP